MSSLGAAHSASLEGRGAFIQSQVDSAANFHLYSKPEGADRYAPHSAREICIAQPIHPFGIEQRMPDPAEGMRAVNRVGAACGMLGFRCLPVAWETRLLPDRDPEAVDLDRGSSQRVAIRNFTIRFDNGHALFLFGAGRLFPVVEAGKPKLLIAAVCDVQQGCGSFAGLEGNVTFCGELSEHGGFRGHLMVRLRDPEGRLLTEDPIAPVADAVEPDSDAVYLSWIGQKMPGPEFTNGVSLAPDGTVRGLNIPVALRHISTAFAVTPCGLRVRRIEVGDVLGKEIGFGKESVPRTPVSGTHQTPYQFEGVSHYSLFDRKNREAGSFVSNVLEGRSFAVRYEKAPEEPGLRFGFFGTSLAGTGCFEGTSAMLYGASGSVLNPPPGIHVISNWYVLRVAGHEERFRAPNRGD